MSLDDPKAWRSTVDKNTGHTYYYHKKTRVSQWVKPDCLIAQEEREREQELQLMMHDQSSSSKGESLKADVGQVGDQSAQSRVLDVNDGMEDRLSEDFRGGYELDMGLNEIHQDYEDFAEYDEYEAAAASAEAAMMDARAAVGAGPSAGSVQGSSRRDHQEQNSSSSYEALDPAAVSMVAQLLDQINHGTPHQTAEALELLLSCCIPSTVDAIAEEDGVLRSLCGVVLKGEDTTHRRLSLKCLWCLSTGVRTSSVQMVSDQSWSVLGSQVHLWGDDIESLLVYCSMLGLLLASKECRGVIDEERVSHLADLVIEVAQEDVTLDMDVLSSHPAEEGLAPLDPRVLQVQAPGTAGHQLSAAVVVALSAQCLRRADYAVRFLEGGGMATLQLVHASPWIGVEVRHEARKQLLRYMEGSSFARETCLDSLLGLGCTYNRIPVAEGTNPLQRHCGFAENDDDEDEEQDESGPISLQEQLESGIISQVEFFDLDESSTVPRDVIWRPRSGCAWKVSSVMLWTRCPALRSTLEDLWHSEGGELELGTNTSANALACVVRYLHSGAFTPLKDFYSSLELVKLAMELGTEALVKEASNAIVRSLSEHTAETVASFARNMNLVELEDAATRFLRGDTLASTRISFSVPGVTGDSSMSYRDAQVSVVEEVIPTTSRAPQRGQQQQQQQQHPQSGGIYGLLLQEQENKSNAEMRESSVGAGSAPPKRGAGNGVPGRVPGTKPVNSKSAFGRGNRTVAASQKRPMGAGQNVREAAELLDEYTPDMSLGNNSAKNEKQMDSPKHQKGVVHSQEKERKVSGRDKRLTEMAKPKEQTVKEKLAERKEAREKLLKRQKERSAQFKVQRESEGNKQTDQQGSPIGIGGGSGDGAGSESSFVDAPMRSSSPLLEKPFSEEQKEYVEAPTIDPNVRRSLASLKSKARQRRSVSDSVDKLESLKDPQSAHGSSSTNIDISVSPRPREAERSSPVSATCTRQSGCSCPACGEFSAGSGDQLARDDNEDVHKNGIVEAVDLGQEQENAIHLPYEPQVPPSLIDSDDDPLESSAESLLESSWDEAEAYPQGAPEPLLDCGLCGRRFRAAAFEKHSKICGKTKKRKPLDMSKKRFTNEERALANHLAKQVKKDAQKGQDMNKNKTGPQWKKDSEAFRAAMRAGKEFSASVKDGAPLPEYRPSGPDPSFVPCPHCGRSFNESAAERHIPKCQNIKAKPTLLKAGSGRGIGTPLSKGTNGKAFF